MKKFVSMMLALLLAFALCIPAAAATARARYCGHCGSRIAVSVERERTGEYEPCKIDSSMRDPEYMITTTQSCTGCDNTSVSVRYETVCNH